jgi:hypothetical protein
MRKLIFIIALVPLAFQSVAGDYQLFAENGKVGVKDASGRVLLPPTFEALGWSDHHFSVVNQVTGYRQKGKWGLINLKQQFITQAIYESITYPGGDRVVVQKALNKFTTKTGMLDLQGKEVVPFYYDGIKVRGLRAIVFIKNGARYEHGVIDVNGKGVLPLRYSNIYEVGSLRFAAQNDQKKTALFSDDGIQLTDFSIDSIAQFENGHALFYQGIKAGLIDREGSVVTEAQWRNIRLSEHKIQVLPFNQWQWLEPPGTPATADTLVPAGRYYIGQSGRNHQLLHANLQPVQPEFYQAIEVISGRLIAARSNNKWGVITISQQEILSFQFDSLVVRTPFLCARSAQGWQVYDTFGVAKTKVYDAIGPYNGKFFPVSKKGYEGAVNRYGEELLACVYDSITQYDDDLLIVKFKGLYGMIDYHEKWLALPQPYRLRLMPQQTYAEYHDNLMILKNQEGKVIYFTDRPFTARSDYFEEYLADGTRKRVSWRGVEISRDRQVIPPRGTDIVFESEGLRGIQRDGRYGFIDANGRLRIANRYEEAQPFSEGLAAVKILGKWGFINTDDKIVINPNFDSVSSFRQRFAQVVKNGKAGLIDYSGTLVLPLRYDSVSLLTPSLVALYLNGRCGLAQIDGAVLLEPRFDRLQLLDADQVLVAQQNKFGVVTRKGMSVLPLAYDFIYYDDRQKKLLGMMRATWRTLK